MYKYNRYLISSLQRTLFFSKCCLTLGERKWETDLLIVLLMVIDATDSSVQCLLEVIRCLIQQFLQIWKEFINTSLYNFILDQTCQELWSIDSDTHLTRHKHGHIHAINFRKCRTRTRTHINIYNKKKVIYFVPCWWRCHAHLCSDWKLPQVESCSL